MIENPYFSAGAGLLGLGTAVALLRQGTMRYMLVLKRQLFATLEVNSKDRAYQWILPYLFSLQQEQPSASSMLFSTGRHLSVQTCFIQRENGTTETSFSMVPSPGIHYLKWHGCWIKIERERTKATFDITTGTPFETLKLTVLARQEKKRSIFKRLLEESRSTALRSAKGKILIFTSWANEWRPFGLPRNKRPLSSVVLDDGIAESILADLKEFIASSQWGYLLYGPPGTGKSSFITALAGALNYNICIINLSENIMTDDRLQYLFSVVPERSVLLLEDVDAAFLARTNNAAQRVTFSGLLNAIDGVASSEERIIFMTTNHHEKLDPALLRPGRVDVQQYLGNVTLFQAKRMFLQFYPTRADLVGGFVEKISTSIGQVSPATIQGHFIQHKNSPEDAIQHFPVQAVSRQASI